MSLNTFDRAKMAQGFQPALARPRCMNCHNRSTAPVNGGYQCMKGGFFVTAWAVCNAHQYAAGAGPAAPGSRS